MRVVEVGLKLGIRCNIGSGLVPLKTGRMELSGDKQWIWRLAVGVSGTSSTTSGLRLEKGGSGSSKEEDKKATCARPAIRPGTWSGLVLPLTSYPCLVPCTSSLEEGSIVRGPGTVAAAKRAQVTQCKKHDDPCSWRISRHWQ